MLCARRRPQARPLRTSPPTSFCTSVRTKNRTRLRQDQHGPSTLVVYAVFSSDDVSVGESENPALHRSTAEAIVKIAEDCQKSKLKSSTPTLIAAPDIQFLTIFGNFGILGNSLLPMSDDPIFYSHFVIRFLASSSNPDCRYKAFAGAFSRPTSSRTAPMPSRRQMLSANPTTPWPNFCRRNGSLIESSS